MKQNNASLIVVPDIHGRPFWKSVFDYDSEVVFLGDYLDPYGSEGIYPWDALDNLIQIIAYAKANPKVHLLLGNHDLCYAKGRHICNSRCDYENYDTLRKLFRENENLFTMAYECTVNGRRFFLSHAGLSFGWYTSHPDIFPYSYEETLRAEHINSLYKDGLLDGILSEIGEGRGGRSRYGSMVWADVVEMQKNMPEKIPEVIQIFGHTQLGSSPLNLEKECRLYDVDVRQCVYIDCDGCLRLLDTGEEI